MGALVREIPKPALKYQGKTLIHHKLEQLPRDITEIIIIVGYLGEKIQEAIGHSYNSVPITYVWQKDLLGTAHSLYSASHLLDVPFLVLMGDDIYGQDDLNNMVQLGKEKPGRWIALVQELKENASTGKCILADDGQLLNIIEDPDSNLPHPLSYTGACLLTPDIFELRMIKPPGREEYGLPQTFIQAAGHRDIRTVIASLWKRVTAPEDLE